MNAAVLTLVRDEQVFLPVWLRYYGQFFRAEDRYVLDNDSRDGSTTGIDAVVRAVPSPVAFDHQWMAEVVNGEVARLFAAGYRAVLYADADELVVAADGDLPRYLTVPPAGVAYRTQGYHVAQTQDEPALDWTQPIGPQRARWVRDPFFDKPLILHTPVRFVMGEHYLWPPGVTEGNEPMVAAYTEEVAVRDPNLFLAHLHRVDFTTAAARHAARAAYTNWSAADLAAGWGAQNSPKWSKHQYAAWFWGEGGYRSKIPEGVRDRF